MGSRAAVMRGSSPAAPIKRDANGAPIAATGTALDITATKRAALALEASETALRERNAQLEEARLIAGLGTWRVDARTDTATWSPGRMFPDGGDGAGCDAPRP